MADDLWDFLCGWEGLLLMVLTVITIFRRRLSSNHEYRLKASKQISRRSIEPDHSAAFLHTYSQIVKTMIFSPHKPDYSLASIQCTDCPLNQLSTELLVHLLGYLDTHEVVTISITSTKMRENFTSDIIWEQIWRVTYGTHWRQTAIRKLRRGRGIHWDPVENFGPPQTGWYHFYLAFEVCWLDWLLAGYATEEKCVLACEDAIFEVTNFLLDHPGSPETLSEAAGCDVTELFTEIGHSIHAEEMKRRMCIWDAFGQYQLQPKGKLPYTLKEDLRAPDVRTPSSSRLQRYMRHMQKSVVTLAITNPEKFLDCRRPVEGLEGFHPCSKVHRGQAKAFYDPLEGEWQVWWTCCGSAQAYVHVNTGT
jgi:hypothetical protein